MFSFSHLYLSPSCGEEEREKERDKEGERERERGREREIKSGHKDGAETRQSEKERRGRALLSCSQEESRTCILRPLTISLSLSLSLSLLCVFFSMCLQLLLAAPPIMLECMFSAHPSASYTAGKAEWLVFTILHLKKNGLTCGATTGC
jgi:hypothetical protein